MTKPIQFNWRRHWSKKVAPHLKNEQVQFALDIGMRFLDSKWKHGDAPYLFGNLTGEVCRRGTLNWYRPHGRCHYIAFFSMAIGVLNYPELDWRFVSNHLHTMPVGYDQDGRPSIVMDILLFDSYTAEQSITFASEPYDPTRLTEQRRAEFESPRAAKGEAQWQFLANLFVEHRIRPLQSGALQKMTRQTAC